MKKYDTSANPSRSLFKSPHSLTQYSFWTSLSILILGFQFVPAELLALEMVTAKRVENNVARLYNQTAPAVVGIESKVKENMFLGTGVIIDPKGLVLTSVTVVPDKARDIRVYLKGGKRVAAEIVKVVTDKEFSLIRIKTKGDYPFLSLGDSNTVKLGQPSITLGNAFMSIVRDDHVCINSGIISGIYKLNSGRSESKYTGKVIETTTLVNDYMDGSPLIDKNGRIIGMLSLNYSTRRWLGTAVPINILKPLFGKYRPWHSDRIHKTAIYLGLDLTEKGDAPAKKGQLIIDGISESSPASRAGIALGSRIVKVAGKEIHSIADYKEALKAAPSGKKIVIEAYSQEKSANSTKQIKMPKKPSVYTLQPWLSF